MKMPLSNPTTEALEDVNITTCGACSLILEKCFLDQLLDLKHLFHNLSDEK